MNSVNLYIILLFISVFISAVSQILLKKAAMMSYDSYWREYINVKVICAYSLFFTSTIITVLGLKYIPLSFVPIIESSGYIFIAFLSYIFLQEKIRKEQKWGMALIILGILVYSIDISV